MWRHTHLQLGYRMPWKLPMIKCVIHCIERPPSGNDYMTSRLLIASFRWGRWYTVGIQKEPDAPIVFIHVDDLKICPPPRHSVWTPEPWTAKSLCATKVAFRPGSHISNSDSTPSVDVSTWNDLNTPLSSADIHLMCYRYLLMVSASGSSISLISPPPPLPDT